MGMFISKCAGVSREPGGPSFTGWVLWAFFFLLVCKVVDKEVAIVGVRGGGPAALPLEAMPASTLTTCHATIVRCAPSQLRSWKKTAFTKNRGLIIFRMGALGSSFSFGGLGNCGEVSGKCGEGGLE